MGITITDVKVVGICSKCRKPDDEILKDIHGRTYDNNEISCVGCAFGVDYIAVAFCKSCQTYNFNFHGTFNYCPECSEKLEQRTYKQVPNLHKLKDEVTQKNKCNDLQKNDV